MKACLCFILGIATIFHNHTMAQNVEEIMDKHVKAIGGSDNWNRVNSLIMSGSMSVQTNEFTFETRILNKKGFRQDINFNGSAGYVIATPKGGWQYLPFNGQLEPEELEGANLVSYQKGIDICEARYVGYREKGIVI